MLIYCKFFVDKEGNCMPKKLFSIISQNGKKDADYVLQKALAFGYHFDKSLGYDLQTMINLAGLGKEEVEMKVFCITYLKNGLPIFQAKTPVFTSLIDAIDMLSAAHSDDAIMDVDINDDINYDHTYLIKFTENNFPFGKGMTTLTSTFKIYECDVEGK